MRRMVIITGFSAAMSAGFRTCCHPCVMRAIVFSEPPRIVKLCETLTRTRRETEQRALDCVEVGGEKCRSWIKTLFHQHFILTCNMDSKYWKARMNLQGFLTVSWTADILLLWHIALNVVGGGGWWLMDGQCCRETRMQTRMYGIWTVGRIADLNDQVFQIWVELF